MYILITLLCFLVSYLFTSSLFGERQSSPLSDKGVECVMEGDVDNDIYRNNPRHKEVIEKREIDDYEQKGQCNNTNQRLMLS